MRAVSGVSAATEQRPPEAIRVQLRGIARGVSKDNQQMTDNNPQEQQSNG